MCVDVFRLGSMHSLDAKRHTKAAVGHIYRNCSTFRELLSCASYSASVWHQQWVSLA